MSQEPLKTQNSTGNTSANSLLPLSDDWAINPPETHLDDSDERRKKTISKSKQWKEFVQFGRQRQELYAAYLPGQNPAFRGGANDATWQVADCVIREMELWINYMEGGSEIPGKR